MILGLGFDPVLPGPLLFLVALLFLAFPVYSYLGRKSSAPATLVPKLVGLRALAVAVLLYLSLRPFGDVSEELVERASITILLDDTKSMTARDMGGNQSRSEALEGFWDATLDVRTAMADEIDLSVFAFGETVAAEEGASFRASGPATAIGTALESVQGQTRTGRLAGVILFSDGCQNAGPSPLASAEGLAAESIRIDAVAIGSDVPGAGLRDVDLRALYTPNRVSAGMELAAEVDLSCLAAAGARIELECELEGAGRTSVTVQVDTARFARRIALPAIRTRGKGKKKLTVRATRLGSEVTFENNVIETEVQIVKDRTMVLVVEGSLRWETKFLLRSLAGTPLLEVQPVYGPGPREAALLSDPATLEDFDVVILGDVPAGRLPEKFLAGLREASLEGRGVLFLGGEAAYSAGGYGQGPLEGMLPIRLAAGKDRVEDEARALPTDEGLTHFACRLEDGLAANRAAWERLPPLVGRHRPGGIKPGASVLVAGAGEPVLVVQRYGEGRTAAFLTDSTWRWCFSEKDTAGFHRRFWRQLVLWLAARDEADEGSVWLGLDPNRSIFDVGDAMALLVQVFDGRGESIDNARVEVEVSAPEGGEPLARRLVYSRGEGRSEGAYRAPYSPSAPGEYRVTARAWRGSEEVGKDERAFRVRAPAGELDDLVARPELLAEIATVAGGRCVPLSQARSILEEARVRARGVSITRHSLVPLWSNGWVLFLFVGLLVAEWALRKKHGLV